MIPVEVTQTPLHYTTFWDWLDHWQTLIAGCFVLLAGVGTVVATMIIARRQIAASRDETDRVIAATRAETDATFKQTESTIRLDQMRDRSEALAFHATLAAAMVRVLNEATWARKTYPQILAQKTGASVDADTIRKCITKGAFAELRAACVRRGGPLTGEFLDLEREIDSFASQCGDFSSETTVNVRIRKGFHAGLDEQLALIEMKAGALRQKAFEAFE